MPLTIKIIITVGFIALFAIAPCLVGLKNIHPRIKQFSWFGVVAGLLLLPLMWQIDAN